MESKCGWSCDYNKTSAICFDVKNKLLYPDLCSSIHYRYLTLVLFYSCTVGASEDVVGTLAMREGMSGLEDSTLSEDSSVFTLLFQQCVKPGETSVDINVLVEFIQRLRLGECKEGEEVFDSHNSVSYCLCGFNT